MLALAKLIVVDDDPEVRAMLGDVLACMGHSVRVAAGGMELRALLAAEPVDIVLLDLNLPGESGLRLAAELRARHDLAILMLSGATSVIDRVLGLEVGADDYLTKPVDTAELGARITAVLRRRPPAAEAGLLPFGDYRFDLGAFRLLDAGGSVVPLKEMELDLVAAFATRPGRVLSREDLLRLAPARGDDTTDRSIDKRITRLRQKLERRPAHPVLIKTIRGGGYLHPRAERPGQRSA